MEMVTWYSVYFSCRISDNRFTPQPFFLFGDFNFRLDTLNLIQVEYLQFTYWNTIYTLTSYTVIIFYIQ